MKFQYVKKFFDSTDATASLRNAAFAVVMIAGVIYLAVDLVVGLIKTGIGITGDWNMGFGILVGAAAGTKIAGARDGKAAPPKDGSE
jgi:hypothetical protein